MKPSVLPCPGPLSRRHFLKIGGLSLGAIGMNGLLPLKLRAKDGTSTPDTSVILIWLPGGPPHMETYDMKPDAPIEYRGDFRPIKTVVPGVDVCEHLPLHAKIAESLHAHPLHCAHLRRSWRRAQEVPHRPRSEGAGRLRQRLSDGRQHGRQGSRGDVARRAELHCRHRPRPRPDRRFQFRLRLPGARRPIRSWWSAIRAARNSR